MDGGTKSRRGDNDAPLDSLSMYRVPGQATLPRVYWTRRLFWGPVCILALRFRFRASSRVLSLSAEGSLHSRGSGSSFR